MDYRWIIDQIHAKGKQEEMVEALVDAIPYLPKDDQRKLEHKLDKIAYCFTPEEAREKVQRMRPYGEHWDQDTVRTYIASKGVDPKHCLQYYLVMNMAYNDYHETAEKFGLGDNTDFYFFLAHDFIDDEDGVEFKVEKYFRLR